MNIKNILTSKKFLKIILILENIFIIFIFVYIFAKNSANFKENFIFYFYTFDIFINENFQYLFFALLSLFFVIFSHIIIWKQIFNFKNIKLTHFQSFCLFSLIHFKRLFSPLGPISPLINISKDLKTSFFIYSVYVYFITWGSILFFVFLFSYLYTPLLFFLPLFFYFGYFLFKKIKSFNLEISFLNYLKLIISSLLNETFSFLTYYFSLRLFDFNISLLNILIVYLAWIIVSSIFPFLYGSGSSELISALIIYNLGYDGALFSLAIIFYRLLITYLPLIGVIIYKLTYPHLTIDK